MQAHAREGEAAHRAEVPTSRMQSRYCVVSMSDKTCTPRAAPRQVPVPAPSIALHLARSQGNQRVLIPDTCISGPVNNYLDACSQAVMSWTAVGAHVAAADIADARLEADHAVAQAVHDGLALPRHALARMRAPQLCWRGTTCGGPRLSCSSVDQRA